MNRSMEQAQTLLCVSGALMMIIIGNSLARAFGIAGAAAIIRFRTPVDDPRDATILFLLLALGMAAGIGALPVAGLGTLALCALLPALDWFSGVTPRTASVECTASGPEFPVQRSAPCSHGSISRPTRVSSSPVTLSRMKYIVSLAPSHRLEDLSGRTGQRRGPDGRRLGRPQEDVITAPRRDEEPMSREPLLLASIVADPRGRARGRRYRRNLGIGAADRAERKEGRTQGWRFTMEDRPSLRFGEVLRVDLTSIVDFEWRGMDGDAGDNAEFGRKRIGIDGRFLDVFAFEVERDVGDDTIPGATSSSSFANTARAGACRPFQDSRSAPND